MKLARLHRQMHAKTKQGVLLVNSLFKQCTKYQHKIIDFELEYTKYTLLIKNAHEAYQYLKSQMPTIL